MKSDNIIQEKSFAFAIRIVNLYKYLTNEKKEFVLSKQILKSGTSIGANIEESIGAQSDKDFLNKISISYKEARESIFWLKLLQATNYLSAEGQKAYSQMQKKFVKSLENTDQYEKSCRLKYK